MSIYYVTVVAEKMAVIISGYEDPNFCFLAGCKLWSGTIVTEVWEMKSWNVLADVKLLTWNALIVLPRLNNRLTIN